MTFLGGCFLKNKIEAIWEEKGILQERFAEAMGISRIFYPVF